VHEEFLDFSNPPILTGIAVANYKKARQCYFILETAVHRQGRKRTQGKRGKQAFRRKAKARKTNG